MAHQWVQIHIRELAADKRQEGPIRPRLSCWSEELETEAGLSWWPESKDTQASAPLSLSTSWTPSCHLLPTCPQSPLSHVPQLTRMCTGCACSRRGAPRGR